LFWGTDSAVEARWIPGLGCPVLRCCTGLALADDDPVISLPATLGNNVATRSEGAIDLLWGKGCCGGAGEFTDGLGGVDVEGVVTGGGAFS
jgi:hypothetical protein